MKNNTFLILTASFLISSFTIAQVGPITGEAQLRLKPIWERVADVYGEAGSVESVEFSPNGRYIVSGTKFDNSVIMWRTSDGMELWRAYAAEEIERVAFSPDGKFVASVSEDYLITVYDAKTGAVTKKIELESAADGLAWGNSKNILISGQERLKGNDGSDKGYVRAYDMDTGKQMYRLEHDHTVNEIQFTRDDSHFLSAATDGSVKVWKTEDGTLVKKLQPEPNSKFKFVCANFSPDSKHVVASGFEGDIFVWEIESGKLIREFNTSGRKIETVTFTPDGKYILTAGNDPYIRMYRSDQVLDRNLKKVPIIYAVHANDQAEYMDFNSDGSFLVSAHQDGIIRLWVFMGEDAALNQKRHENVKKSQSDALQKS
ncbi:MAG: hypothetical protein Mars2KO_41960 [Maribacter sp.]